MNIVITGGSSGIGKSFLERMLKRHPENEYYELSRRESSIIGENIHHIFLDLSKEESVRNAAIELFSQIQEIDVLINNAGMGISGAYEYTNDLDEKDILNINLNHTMLFTRLCLPYVKKGTGKILFTGSVASIFPIAYQTLYSVTKFGILSFSRALKCELKPQGIQTCCILPGDTHTGFTDARRKNDLGGKYQKNMESSVQKMEKSELNGKSPMTVAKVMEKCIYKKRIPSYKTVGFGYKCLVFLNRILPTRLVDKILYQLYGR